MTFHDTQYLNLANKILLSGHTKGDRTGTGTTSIFGAEMRFDLSDGSIPLLTTKKMHWPSIMYELLWYISGSTNNNDLEKNNVRIWREWADSSGDLGPLYGKMLRNWDGIDQLQDVIDLLRSDPDSRRMVVSYWNPKVLPDPTIAPKDNPPKGLQALPPCHYTWQVYTRALTEAEREMWPTQTRQLSLKMTQRSCDLFLGVPYNIAQYSILLHMLSYLSNMVPGEFIWSGGDTHIYSNHQEQIREQLTRTPYQSPCISFHRDVDNIDQFTFDDIVLCDYVSHPLIKGTVAT